MTRSSLEDIVSLLDLLEHALSLPPRGESGVGVASETGQASVSSPAPFPVRGMMVAVREIRRRVSDELSLRVSAEPERTAVSQGREGAPRAGQHRELVSPATGSQGIGNISESRRPEPPRGYSPASSETGPTRSQSRVAANARGLAARIQMSPLSLRGYQLTGEQQAGSGNVREISLVEEISSGESRS